MPDFNKLFANDDNDNAIGDDMDLKENTEETDDMMEPETLGEDE